MELLPKIGGHQNDSIQRQIMPNPKEYATRKRHFKIIN
jgi:hypothetical protein